MEDETYPGKELGDGIGGLSRVLTLQSGRLEVFAAVGQNMSRLSECSGGYVRALIRGHGNFVRRDW